jgi:hypothetical protein
MDVQTTVISEGEFQLGEVRVSYRQEVDGSNEIAADGIGTARRSKMLTGISALEDSTQAF